MKKLFTLLALGACLSHAKAQPYLFSSTADVYTDLGSGGTAFDFSQYRTKIPIGFSATVLGFTNTKLYVYPTGSFSTDSIHFFYPFGAEVSQGTPRYFLTGTTGNRILKMQYKNIKFDHNFTNTDFMNFQAWLFEADNSIEFHYGSSHITDPANDYYYDQGGPGVGHYGQFLSGDPIGPDEDTAYVHLSGTPPSGTIYRFALPVATGIAKQENKKNEVMLFPVPATEAICIVGTNSQSEVIRVLDLQGRTLMQVTDQAAGQPLNIDGLQPGQYFIEMGKTRRCFIKE